MFIKINTKKEKGFTLMELLIVVAIMGIMSVVALSSFIKSQKKGRDAKRKQDLSEIRKALELYNHDNNRYPDNIGGSLKHPNLPDEIIYMVKIPGDPKSSLSYDYESVDSGQGFEIHAHLEHENDPDINCSIGSGKDCGAKDCNFIVASPGTPLPGICSS